MSTNLRSEFSNELKQNDPRAHEALMRLLEWSRYDTCDESSDGSENIAPRLKRCEAEIVKQKKLIMDDTAKFQTELAQHGLSLQELRKTIKSYESRADEYHAEPSTDHLNKQRSPSRLYRSLSKQDHKIRTKYFRKHRRRHRGHSKPPDRSPHRSYSDRHRNHRQRHRRYREASRQHR